MESKFKVGDKVVPVSKSVGSRKSNNWKWAKELKQPFLYVTGYEDENNAIVCAQHWGVGGDYFLESDLIHYVEPKK